METNRHRLLPCGGNGGEIDTGSHHHIFQDYHKSPQQINIAVIRYYDILL